MGSRKPRLRESSFPYEQVRDQRGDYYSWRCREVTGHGERIVVCSKPGMPENRTTDVASLLMADNLEIHPADTVVDLNCGAGMAGVAAARLATGGRVIMADSNVVEVEAARRTVEANHVANAAVYLSSGTSHLSLLPPADVATVRALKATLPTLQLIWDAFHALGVGGRLSVAGANDEGIKTVLARVQALFGNVAVLDYRKGCRVGVATRRSPSPPVPDEFSNPLLDHRVFHRYIAEIRGRPHVVCSRPGVFSWERLDPGSKALIDVMRIDPGDQVLDLGGGAGIVGVVAAGLASPGQVHLVDADIDAVDSAIQTARENGVTNCTIRASDSVSAVRGLDFDVVLTNAPFHLAKAAEYDVAIQFIQDAAAVLKGSGRLYLVANRFLPYERPMEQAFAMVETVYADNRYKVLLGRSPRRKLASTPRSSFSPRSTGCSPRSSPTT
ncbi:MAG: methyltransferase [Chloroflexi bacterium]|nr:methyltransferase [Chloroflexota bacterium]